MKSFVDFLTEGKKPDPNPTSSPTGGGSGGGKPPKNPPLSSAEIEAIKRQAQADMGPSSMDWWDETDDNIKKNRNRNIDDLTTGGEVKTNKPQQKPLKKLIQRASKDQKARGLKVGDLDPKFSAELEAKRKARIDPKTGKATQQGVKNFAQNIGGYRRRNIPKDELSRIFKYADNVARDPSSKEYKRIEAEINKSDYAGKRAKVPSIKQLDKIKSDIKTSKTINQKGGKLNIPRTSRLLNTSTRKGRIGNIPVNKAQTYTKKINDIRLEKEANKVIEKLRRIRKNETSGLKSRMSNAYVNRQRKLKNSANEILKSISKDSKSSSTFKYKSPPTANPDLGKTKVRQSVKGPGSSTGSLSRANLRFSGDANYQKLKKTIDPVKTKTVNPQKTYNQFQKDISRIRGKKSNFTKANLLHQVTKVTKKVPKVGVDPFSGAFEYARQRDQKNATPKRAIAGGAINAISSYAGFKKGASTAARIASPLLAAPFPGARPLYGLTVLGGGIAGQVLTTKATQTAFDQALGKKGTRVATQTDLEKEKNKNKTKVITANQGKGKNTKAVVPPTSKGSGGFGLNLAK